MNVCNTICRAVTMIAVFMIGLSGCGGGSNSGGLSTATAPTVPTVQPTNKVPDTPVGVSAVGGTNKVTISWNAVSGATSYNIYWATAAGVTLTAGTRVTNAGNILIQRGLLATTTYYYIVTAQNNTGESVASGQVSAATAELDGTVPYTTYCAGCHGYLATSTVTNASVMEIKAALHNINPMSALTLTDSQIAAISDALMYNK